MAAEHLRAMRHHLRVFGAYVSLHAKTAMEYRTNFLSQAGFMLLNDLIFLIVWFFLFSAFPLINGYGIEYAMLVFGISAFAFGFTTFFFGNRRGVWEIIVEGRLDTYLSQPVDELFHVLIGKSNADGFGDMLFGIGLIAYFRPEMLLVGILVGILGGVTLLGFMILLDCTGFVMERPQATTKSLNALVLGFGSWPLDAFGSPRSILYAIPFAFIAVVPYHVITTFSWMALGGLAAVAFTMLAIAVLLWKMGIRKYESGNLVTMRG